MAGRWADCWNAYSEQKQELRLDPCQLPQKTSFHAQSGILNCTLTENAVIVQHTYKQKFDNIIEIVPLSSYHGVSAHRLKNRKNNNFLALMLVHPNPAFSIPLLISNNYDDVLLDWRLWADLYDLPMLVIDEFGELRPVRECAPLDYFLHEYAPLQSLFNDKVVKYKKYFQLRLPNRRLKLRLKLSNRLIIF